MDRELEELYRKVDDLTDAGLERYLCMPRPGDSEAIAKRKLKGLLQFHHDRVALDSILERRLGPSKPDAILECITAQAQVESDLARLESLEPTCRMNPLPEYLFRSIMCNIFNVHSSFCTIHNYILAFATVKQD